jgi:2-polyprenyl-3-methyl-5-hydroxy-6-metoxy-1,4-benzoquinol methylase
VKAEELQKNHFNTLASDYAKYYGSTWVQAYRYKFMNKHMFDKINLSGFRVLDAMCGNGETTGYLLQQKALVTGIDISQKEIQNFKKQWPDCTAHCSSILSTGLEASFYDCVVVVGGLHHIHPQCSEAINEINRLLKPGGYFCFTEPHKGSLPDLARRFWYRLDNYFLENEAALNLESLKQEFSSKFNFIKEEYRGNVAYLFVYNAMVLRMPLWLVRLYAPVLLFIESIIEKFQGKRLSCFVVCQWQKKPEDG